MTTRRQFISLLGGAAAAWPLAARAQQAGHMRRIGVLLGPAESDPEGQARVMAFRDGLRKLGWTEGRAVHIEYRWGDSSAAQMLAGAADLVASNPEVIFAAPSSAVAALQRTTRSIPIVFAQVADPVGAGFVGSLSRPGGNITGFAVYEFGIGAKWVELVKQIAPSVTHVGILYDPANPASTGYLPMIDAAARSSGVQTIATAVRDASEIERAIAKLANEPNGGLIAVPSPAIVAHRGLIIALSARSRLPNVFAYRFNTVSGALASYGVDNIDLYRKAASYVDRILRGEKPADLPVQLATKFELVINLKTAKALGLTVPDTLLVAADEVIE